MDDDVVMPDLGVVGAASVAGIEMSQTSAPRAPRWKDEAAPEARVVKKNLSSIDPVKLVEAIFVVCWPKIRPTVLFRHWVISVPVPSSWVILKTGVDYFQRGEGSCDGQEIGSWQTPAEHNFRDYYRISEHICL